MSAPGARVLADSARVLADSAPVLADSARVLADSARVLADSAPVLADSARVLADSAPDARVLADSAPDVRVLADSARVLADSAPDARVLADSARVLADSAPDARVLADSARVLADSAPDARVLADSAPDARVLADSASAILTVLVVWLRGPSIASPTHDSMVTDERLFLDFGMCSSAGESGGSMRGFGRVSVGVPVCAIANPMENARRTLALWQQAHEAGAHIVVFPELGLSGYTARDLFLDRHLLDTCETALQWLRDAGKDLSPLAVVGTPLRDKSALYNTAVGLQAGRIVGAVPKAYLPNYREFEERRWFRPGTDRAARGRTLNRFGDAFAFGTDVLFHASGVEDLILGVEVCEDYWVQLPPSTHMVNAGATVIANLSASNFTIGKADLRRLLARSQSDRGKCAYLYVAAGPGESSTDLAFDADAFICDNGAVLAESERFSRDAQLITCDVDLESLVRERMVTTTFGDCAAHDDSGQPASFRAIPFVASENDNLLRTITPHPFLPRDESQLTTRCWEIFEIQTHALLTRMRAIGAPKLVLGVSGGLDSTQAALVAAAALDLDGRPRTDLVCVTMPGLGTTEETKSNATELAAALGATFETTSVADLSHAVLTATGHKAAKGADDVAALVDALRADASLGDRTLENVQARLRTLVLMTRANACNGIVLGTGDLSEKALGWSTYNGDHIAMYDVNAGIPKTLIQFVIKWVARDVAEKWSDHGAANLRETLAAIVDTPISPELLPPDASGKIAQLTEDTIGPYELHDFFLFHLVRHGATPERVLHLAEHAFGDAYPFETLKKWFTVFLKRFFTNQFKRSCTADGPKVGMVALSPRGDWRMPSDAQVAAWAVAAEVATSSKRPSS